MNNLNYRVRSILLRARKLLWLVILLPIITAAAAYFFASQTPVSYQGTAKVMFGNFENEYLTKPDLMMSYIQSDKFINDAKEKYNIELEDLKSSLQVQTSSQDKSMTLSMSGSSKDNVEEDLSAYLEALIKISSEVYNAKVNAIENSIKELENTDTEVEEIAKQKELHDLKYTLSYEMENTQIVDDVTVTESPRVSPVQRAIIGFLAGIILSLFILVIPEVFKE